MGGKCVMKAYPRILYFFLPENVYIVLFAPPPPFSTFLIGPQGQDRPQDVLTCLHGPLLNFAVYSRYINVYRQ